MITVCKINDKSDSNRDNLLIETFETSSVYNLSKTIQERTKIDPKNMVIYYSRKLMVPQKALAEYGIYKDEDIPSSKKEFYKIKIIEKKVNPAKNMLSLGLNSSFYKINSVRKVEWEEDAPWYREVQNGLNWVAYCKNIG